MSKRTSIERVAQSLWDLLPEEIQQAILRRANAMVSADALRGRLRFTANHIKQWFGAEKPLTLRQRAKGFGKRMRYFASVVLGRDGGKYSHYLPLQIGSFSFFTSTYTSRRKIASSYFRSNYPNDMSQSTHNGLRNVDAIVVSNLQDMQCAAEHFADIRSAGAPVLPPGEMAFLKHCLTQRGEGNKLRMMRLKMGRVDFHAKVHKFIWPHD